MQLVHSALFGEKIYLVICHIFRRNMIKWEQNYAFANEDVTLEAAPRCHPVQLRDRTDKEHHHEEITPFVDLNVDLISTFTIDGMHTIYLGVCRRFLTFLQSAKNIRLTVKGKSRPHLSAEQMKLIGEHFSGVRSHGGSSFPREFTCSARDFVNFDKWKPTEFRMFVNYGGDMALSGSGTGVPSVLVTAFRCFTMAVRLLSDPTLYIPYIKFARALLHCFVDSCVAYFGKHFVTLIVHVMLHLPDECIKHGPLDSFSCWRFENTLKSLKKRCRNFKTPLGALATQLSQKSTFISKPSRNFQGNTSEVFLKCPVLTRLERPVLDGQSYKTVFYKNHAITIDTPDCYFMSKTKQVYMILDIIHTSIGTQLICNQYDKVCYAYYVPTATGRFESSTLGVLRLLHLNDNLEIIDLHDFYRKCVIRVFDKETFCYPIMLLQ